MSRGYDPACLDLAEHFLEDAAGLKDAIAAGCARRLAQRIQDTIEAFLEDEAEDAKENT